MRSAFYFLAGLAGAAIPFQALINAHLGRAIGGPLWAAAASFAIGALTLVVYGAAFSGSAPLVGQALASLPWWAWIGGVLGAFFVASSTIVVTEIGAAGLVSTVIVGQLLSAVLLDHYGILHAAQPIGLSRIVGMFLLAVGAWLITRTPG